MLEHRQKQGDCLLCKSGQILLSPVNKQLLYLCLYSSPSAPQMKGLNRSARLPGSIQARPNPGVLEPSPKSPTRQVPPNTLLLRGAAFPWRCAVSLIARDSKPDFGGLQVCSKDLWLQVFAKIRCSALGHQFRLCSLFALTSQDSGILPFQLNCSGLLALQDGCKRFRFAEMQPLLVSFYGKTCQAYKDFTP